MSEVEKQLQGNIFSTWMFRITSALVPVGIIAMIGLCSMVNVHSSQIGAIALSVKDLATSVDKINVSGTAGLAVERAERGALAERVSRNERTADAQLALLTEINKRLVAIEISQARTETIVMRLDKRDSVDE